MFLRIIEAALTGFITALIIMFLLFDLTKLRRIFYPPSNDNSEKKDNSS